MAQTSSHDDAAPERPAIRLGQFLQLMGLVDSGGEAKEAIREGYVRVNGEVDTRRGRQLQPGDVVELDGREAVVEV